MIECLLPGPQGLTIFLFLLTQYSVVHYFEPFSLLYPLVYLDLFESEDDTSISKGSFMRTKHIFILIHIRNKGDVGTIKHV